MDGTSVRHSNTIGVTVSMSTRPTASASATPSTSSLNEELIAALQNPTPATPFTQLGNEQMMALQRLANIFNNATSKNDLTPAPRMEKPRFEKPAPTPGIRHPPPRGVTKAIPPAPTRSIRHPPPRVAKANPTASLRVAKPRMEKPHRYPTRQQANLVATIADTASQLTLLQPDSPTDEQWQPLIANHVTDPKTGEIQEYRYLIKKGHCTYALDLVLRQQTRQTRPRLRQPLRRH
jgi:hypothetical protein